MSLHLVFNERGLAHCLARSAPEDVVVLLGDAVYCPPPEQRYHYLAEDAHVRGVDLSSRASIDYPALVELTTQHSPIVSWNSA